MKIIESADGTIKVIELDPTKKHWIVADTDTGIDWETVQMIDGLILLKRPRTAIDFVEGDEPPQVPL